MNDLLIIDIYNNTKLIKGKTFKTLKNKNIDIYNYLMSRYNDCIGNECPTEIVYRIINHIDIRPTCVICGKPLSYSKSKGRYDKHFCSKECERSEAGLKIVKSIVRSVKLQKYGNPYYNNREKYKQTCLERFGETNPNKCIDIIKKSKVTRDNTMIERYGTTSYNNREK